VSATERTVLVVEDEDDLRELLLSVLINEGYAVAGAADGREALDVLRRLRRPCVVVLDLIMPHVSGNDVYAAMQADPSLADIPVVISTSDPSRAPSGVPVMKKPVRVQTLLTTLAAMFP
jgi:two-component system, sensor histidine kinase and response regulator